MIHRFLYKCSGRTVGPSGQEPCPMFGHVIGIVLSVVVVVVVVVVDWLRKGFCCYS